MALPASAQDQAQKQTLHPTQNQAQEQEQDHDPNLTLENKPQQEQQEGTRKEEPSGDVAKKTSSEQMNWEQSLIDRNILVSEWFDGVADGIDLFLAGKRYTSKRNTTSAVVETSAYYTEVDGLSFNANFNVNLRLPNVEEYWMLTFTSYDELQERSARSTYLRQTPRERNYGASVGFFKKLGEVRTAFQPRITFEGTPAISHSLSFESVAERRTYRLNPKLEFYATPSKGAGVFQAMNFNWILTRMFSLTFINEGDYVNRPHEYTVTNGLSLGQFFNARQTLSYNFFVTSSNRPNYQLAGYNISLAWKQVVYRRILEYQVIPNLDFHRDHGYVMNPGITLNVDIYF